MENSSQSSIPFKPLKAPPGNNGMNAALDTIDTAIERADKARDVAHLRLIVKRLADAEPNGGWDEQRFLEVSPELSLAETMFIWRAQPVEVVDVLDYSDLVDECLTGDHFTQQQIIERACRASLWHAVLAECEQRDMDREQERRDRQWRRECGYRMEEAS